jgi:hypothetical protein
MWPSTSATRAAFALHAEAGAQFDAGFFHHIRDLVAQQSLVGVGRVKSGQLARIAQDGIALCDLYAVHVQHRHLAKGHRLAHLGKFGEAKAVVFKRNATNGQGQADRLSAAAVKVEIGEFELGHGVYLKLWRGGPAAEVLRILCGQRVWGS